MNLSCAPSSRTSHKNKTDAQWMCVHQSILGIGYDTPSAAVLSED